MVVFDKDWFQKHQALLLKLANTRFGRRLLQLNGRHSGVRSRRIVRIEPHAVTWDNQDGTHTAELHTNDAHAIRLYKVLRPLWWTLHGWDIAIANRLAPSLNAGFDTLSVFPQRGRNPTTTIDSYVSRFGTGSESLATIRSGVGTDVDPTDLLYVELSSRSTANAFNILQRSILTFDTSTISPLATVTAATLQLTGNDKVNDFGGSASLAIHVVGATPALNNRMSTSDYANTGSTSFANIPYLSFDANNPNSFSLNSSGMANVNKGGITAFGLRSSWDLNNSFGGTWSSFSNAYFTMESADTAFDNSEKPKLTVTYTHVSSITISGTLLTSGGVSDTTQHVTSISGTIRIGATFQITKQIAPVAGKEHLFRVYDQTRTYIGVWTDVISVPEFEQRINTAGTTMNVTLGRNANTTIETRDTLATEAGVNLSTEAGQDIAVDTVTNNTVGPGTDVMENYFVDCYVYYGTFDNLETESGQIITTEAGEDILFPLGAPLGRRIFSGWIMDYSANYGDKDGVDVTIASNGSELANTPITSGSNTTVSYSGLDPGQVIRNIMALNSGSMTFTVGTVALTGGSISPTYRLNSILEGIEDVYNRSPDGWYWYGNVADNNVYYQQKSATVNHTFILGKHIQAISIKKTLENLKNVLYFVGGDPGSGVLYKKYTGSSSVNRTGLDRQTDSRVTGAADALAIATKTFARFQNPVYTTTVTISSGTYDIETIQLGQVVTFADFGNFIDGLLLQVVSLHYHTYTVDLELGEVLDKQIDIIANIQDGLDTSNWSDIPLAPS